MTEPPDFLKLDVDGGEVDVLEGAPLPDIPAVIVETHSRELEQECGKLLMEAGHEVMVVNQRWLSPDFRPSEHNRWLVAEGPASTRPEPARLPRSG